MKAYRDDQLRRGFAMRELVAAMVAVVLGLGVVVVLGVRRANDNARMFRDGTQLRSMIQAMSSFSSNNRNQYPTPSLMDKNGATVAGPAEEKDTTANIASSLIYNCILIPEVCVSAAEVNPNIKPCLEFRCGCKHDSPLALDAKNAVWDPQFRGDFTTGIGNISYANLQPSGRRLDRWNNTGNSTTIIWANRGPEITSVERAADGTATPRWRTDSSNAFAIHGAPGKWNGNLAFADNHVEFISGLARTPEEVQGKGWGGYDRRDGDATRRAPDVWHYDEPDDVHGSANTYLGIFVKSGKTPADFRAIWD